MNNQSCSELINGYAYLFKATYCHLNATHHMLAQWLASKVKAIAIKEAV